MYNIDNFEPLNERFGGGQYPPKEGQVPLETYPAAFIKTYDFDNLTLNTE